MPSLISVTTFLFTIGLCSARCTSGKPQSKPSSTLVVDQNLSTPSVDDSATLVDDLSSTIDDDTETEVVSSSAAIASGDSAATTTTSGSSILDNFKPGAKFQIAIQDSIDPRGGLQPADATVVDVDLFLASKDPTLIPTLHAAGATVLCYFNAGAVQYTDCDWPDWNTDGLVSNKAVANYDQERYVDVTSETVVTYHKARIDLAHSIGCDGVDPDNIDTYELEADESVGKQLTQEDMVTFLEDLATYAHSKTTTLGHPLMIGQKNAVDLTEKIHSFMDFAISENCVGTERVGSNRGNADEFCSIFQAYYADNGKPVFDIEYPESLVATKRRRDSVDIPDSDAGCSAGISDSDLETYCNADNSTGISRILKLDNDAYGLNGCTQYCGESASFVLPTYESNSTNSCCFGDECS